jgi:hypothetical protein
MFIRLGERNFQYLGEYDAEPIDDLNRECWLGLPVCFLVVSPGRHPHYFILKCYVKLGWAGSDKTSRARFDRGQKTVPCHLVKYVSFDHELYDGLVKAKAREEEAKVAKSGQGASRQTGRNLKRKDSETKDKVQEPTKKRKQR